MSYFAHPILTGVLLAEAGRRAGLSADDHKLLMQAINPKNLGVSGQALDDAIAADSSAAAFADATGITANGTFLQWLITNLPQILAAIAQILAFINNLNPTPAPTPASSILTQELRDAWNKTPAARRPGRPKKVQ